MSHFEFAIPVQKDELLESHAGQYHVEDVVQIRLLLSKIQGRFVRFKYVILCSYLQPSYIKTFFSDAARAYNAEGVEYILEHFDTYFSIIVHGSKLEWNIINKGDSSQLI